MAFLEVLVFNCNLVVSKSLDEYRVMLASSLIDFDPVEDASSLLLGQKFRFVRIVREHKEQENS